MLTYQIVDANTCEVFIFADENTEFCFENVRKVTAMAKNLVYSEMSKITTFW